MSLTKMQKEYLQNCCQRWNIKTGATGSGKSYLDCLVTIPQRILADHGEGLFVLIGNTRGTLERNILEPMRDIWGSGLIGNIRNDNTVYLFGKKCHALGADSKKHVQRIQGATFEYVYGDEVTTWSEEVFQMLKSRLRCEHSHFDGTCNPASPNHWFKAFLDSDADIYQQAYQIDDGVLPEYVVEELKKEYAGTVYYKRYIEGLWAQAEGLIYPTYENALVNVQNEYWLDYCISLDYGTQNATAGLLWAFDGSVWYAIREYYYSGRTEGHQKTDEDYVQDMIDFCADIPGNMRVIVDPSAASFIAALRRSGKFTVQKARNDVLNGIRETGSAMQRGLIKISDKLENWKKEAAGYCWDENSSNDAPLKADDHLMDSMRYLVATKYLARHDNKRGQE